MAGRKIYYKIIVRICELIEREENLRIFNEGYVIIEEDKFEGYISLDYIAGIYNKEENLLSIEIEDFDNPTEFFIFSGKIEELELPGIYILDTEVPDDNKICYLEFVNIEKEPLKQKEMNKILREVKYIHKIPN